MSDVLNAEKVREIRRYAIGHHSNALYDDDPACFACSVHELVESHEQLRGERDALDEARIVAAKTIRDVRADLAAAQADVQAQADTYIELARIADARLAAVRAGGCAADLREALEKIADGFPKTALHEGAAIREMRAVARDALAAYDRAVSGQTAEKEKALRWYADESNYVYALEDIARERNLRIIDDGGHRAREALNE